MIYILYIYICILYIYIYYIYIHFYIRTLFAEVYWYNNNKLAPIADDAAVISGLEKGNQILLNLFSRWCSWADMIR